MASFCDARDQGDDFSALSDEALFNTAFTPLQLEALKRLGVYPKKEEKETVAPMIENYLIGADGTLVRPEPRVIFATPPSVPAFDATTAAADCMDFSMFPPGQK